MDQPETGLPRPDGCWRLPRNAEGACGLAGFRKKVNEATGLQFVDIITLLDQRSLGLDPKH